MKTCQMMRVNITYTYSFQRQTGDNTKNLKDFTDMDACVGLLILSFTTSHLIVMVLQFKADRKKLFRKLCPTNTVSRIKKESAVMTLNSNENIKNISTFIYPLLQKNMNSTYIGHICMGNFKFCGTYS